MADCILIKKNAYFDSVTLMALSGRIKELPGVLEAVVAMATAMNKDLLKSVGLFSYDISQASEADLVIAVRADTDETGKQAQNLAETMLAKRPAGAAGTVPLRPYSQQAALAIQPETNLAVISVPGRFAAREAEKALANGLHVMLFSDNVTVEEEKYLKKLAHEKNLLMMGPDCGTAIINGVGLCFANVVRPGRIGVIGASGTGLQEVTVIVDQLGAGISQAIGVGGRDLQEAIGGVMMLDAYRALSADPDTDVIVLVSKPPAASVAEKIEQAIAVCDKPVVACFSGKSVAIGKAYLAMTLEEAAMMAVNLANGRPPQMDDSWRSSVTEQAALHRKGIGARQQYVRGLFCGGTLCSEAVSILRNSLGAVYSNIDKEQPLTDINTSVSHTCIDLGDDVFTVGRPHPMIEPGLRLPRLLAEAANPEVAVLLLDIVLGYGSHPDPAGITAPAINTAIANAAAEGRKLVVIAYVCGTGNDKQVKSEQEKKLLEAGAILAQSNAHAASLAAAIALGREAV